MRDTNLALRKAYTAALAGISFNSVAVESYYAELPNNVTPEPANYIVFGSISNNDTSTKSSSDTSTTIQVSIHTKKDIYNNGNAAEDIADQIYQRIYNNTSFRMSVTGFQLLGTRVVSDITQPIQMTAQLKYIDRIIIFSHNIYQN